MNQEELKCYLLNYIEQRKTIFVEYTMYMNGVLANITNIDELNYFESKDDFYGIFESIKSDFVERCHQLIAMVETYANDSEKFAIVVNDMFDKHIPLLDDHVVRLIEFSRRFSALDDSITNTVIKDNVDKKIYMLVNEAVFHIKNRILDKYYCHSFVEDYFPMIVSDLLTNDENENRYVGGLKDRLEKLIILKEYLKEAIEYGEIDDAPADDNDSREENSSVLNSVFYEDNINDFLAIESELVNNGYLSDSRKWVKKKKVSNKSDLANMIRLMKDYKYFRNGLNDMKLITFFGHRYEVNIEQEFYRGKRRYDFVSASRLFDFIKDKR